MTQANATRIIMERLTVERIVVERCIEVAGRARASGATPLRPALGFRTDTRHTGARYSSQKACPAPA